MNVVLEAVEILACLLGKAVEISAFYLGILYLLQVKLCMFNVVLETVEILACRLGKAVENLAFFLGNLYLHQEKLTC